MTTCSPSFSRSSGGQSSRQYREQRGSSGDFVASLQSSRVGDREYGISVRNTAQRPRDAQEGYDHRKVRLGEMDL